MPSESLPFADPRTPHRPTKPPSPNVTISPITSTTLAAYRRVISTLLPIRYPDRFYKDSVANTSSSSLALCAFWKDTPGAGEAKRTLRNESISSQGTINEPLVIGGIQCRLEPVPTPPTSTSSASSAQSLYIQTLAVLSPYRYLGIATALLDAIITTAITHYSTSAENVTEIYAHVWEANVEAVEWYVKRGFVVEGSVVEGYYRKLRPSGARVVRRKVGAGDWLRIREMEGGKEGEVTKETEVAARHNRTERSANG